VRSCGRVLKRTHTVRQALSGRRKLLLCPLSPPHVQDPGEKFDTLCVERAGSNWMAPWDGTACHTLARDAMRDIRCTKRATCKIRGAHECVGQAVADERVHTCTSTQIEATEPSCTEPITKSGPILVESGWSGLARKKMFVCCAQGPWAWPWYSCMWGS
jgi:hypothetical protein